MPDLAPFLPLAVAAGVVVLVVVAAVVALRIARRSPRARAVALAQRSRAAASVIALDDAIAELDLDLTLSGALTDAGAPASLRRARMTAQHARDDAFAELRACGTDASPVDIRRAAQQVRQSTGAARAVVDAARSDHDAWVRTHATPTVLIGAARARLAEIRAALGDPAALTRELARFDEAEWRDAADASADAGHAAAEAAARLDEAESLAVDPSRDARPALEAAERALRRAAADEHALEEAHRLVMEAARAVPGELAAARVALREAADARRAMPPADAERLTGELTAVAASLDQVQADAARRPLAAVHTIAQLRTRLDQTVGDALTLQQRTRSGRTALPGTLAAARSAVAHAEARLRGGAHVDARILLADAQHDLAIARGADDVIGALTAARRAMVEADQAVARITPED